MASDELVLILCGRTRSKEPELLKLQTSRVDLLNAWGPESVLD